MIKAAFLFLCTFTSLCWAMEKKYTIENTTTYDLKVDNNALLLLAQTTGKIIIAPDKKSILFKPHYSIEKNCFPGSTSIELDDPENIEKIIITTHEDCKQRGICFFLKATKQLSKKRKHKD